MLKQFVEEQHAIHDAEAKEAVRKFWVELGYDCIENLDEFGVDLLVDDKGREFGCEVETKTGCHGPEFNYPSLRIPFRKKKFTKDRVTFFVLNSGRTHAAVVSRQKLLKSPAVQVKNKMVRWVITSTKLIRRTLSLSIYLLIRSVARSSSQKTSPNSQACPLLATARIRLSIITPRQRKLFYCRTCIAVLQHCRTDQAQLFPCYFSKL